MALGHGRRGRPGLTGRGPNILSRKGAGSKARIVLVIKAIIIIIIIIPIYIYIYIYIYILYIHIHLEHYIILIKMDFLSQQPLSTAAARLPDPRSLPKTLVKWTAQRLSGRAITRPTSVHWEGPRRSSALTGLHSAGQMQPACHRQLSVQLGLKGSEV